MTAKGFRNPMTIHIHRVQATDDNAMELISEPDDLVRRIVRAWHNSVIPHCFKNKGGFIKAVHRNRKTLISKAPEGIGMLFTSSNYLFSTKAEGRKETLYFKARATGQTGRLRQQHSKGPLAKIDKEPRTHLFLSKDRFRTEKGRNKCKGGRPCFSDFETHKKSGNHHLEFWRDSTGVFHCHFSRGTVRTIKRDDLKVCLDRALEEILGIGQESATRRRVQGVRKCERQ
jgi:hypothetical protein